MQKKKSLVFRKVPKECLNLTQKARPLKVKIANQTSSKLKTIVPRNTPLRIKIATGKVKRFATHTSDKGLVHKIKSSHKSRFFNFFIVL